ncbi:hypothetical protein AURDEDRAFT_126665 [Auricularia subglabra TFB-10046 SS5]|nr:hypothetical protein AURDEDRAFT_126665 [Auricularia subglabra TFB-10046 SS5]
MPVVRTADSGPSASAAAPTTLMKARTTRLDPEQSKALGDAYGDNPCPDQGTPGALAKRVQMDPRNVSISVKTKRYTERKKSLRSVTTTATSNIQSSPKSPIPTSSLPDPPEQRRQQGRIGVAYYVYPIPLGVYYPAYPMGSGIYGYEGNGPGYYDPMVWPVHMPVPPPATSIPSTPAIVECGPISHPPSLVHSSSTLNSTVTSSPIVETSMPASHSYGHVRPPLSPCGTKQRPPQMLERACAKGGGSEGRPQDDLLKEWDDGDGEKEEPPSEQDDTTMVAMFLAGLRGR